MSLNIFVLHRIGILKFAANHKFIQTELDVAYTNTNFKYKLEWGKTHQLSDVTFEEDLLHEIVIF